MKRKCAVIAEYRSKIHDNNVMVIHVGSNDEYMKESVAEVFMDGRSIPFTMERRDTARSRNCYKSSNVFFSCEYQYIIPVTDNFNSLTFELGFREELKAEPQKIIITGKAFRASQKKVFECVDKIKKADGEILIKGWTTGVEKTKIELFQNNKPLKCEIKYHLRKDIKDCFLEGECEHPTGFEITIKDETINIIKMVMTNGDRQTVRTLYTDRENSKKNYLHKVKLYWRKYGFRTMASKAWEKLIGMSNWDYAHWIREHEATKEELEAQKTAFFKKKPLFSIVVPVYNPSKEFFVQMVKSVLNQTYANWELCIADGGDSVLPILDKIAGKDKRIKYISLTENLGISENTNKALEIATGDYIVLGDHDDIIRPDALYECAKAINENPECDVIYSDEDKIEGKNRKLPNFKPDFSPDFLRSNNYICHLFVFSRELYEKVGGFNSEYDGAQDHDLIFRCCENARQIIHIPKILYSWRMHANSTSMESDSKMYAFINGKKAVEAHMERVGLKGEVVMNKEHPGVCRIIYDLPKEPLVSILIPNKDHTEDLDKCIRSVIKQNYTNYEIIVIENNSTEQATFEYYESVQKEFDCVKVLYWESEFNYSAINNFGASKAKGEYFLLLNNDTEMLQEDCLKELVSYGLRPEVGIVGAKLLYGDGTIQHAGVIVGLGGLAAHAFAESAGNDTGYQMRAAVAMNLSAVTAACLLVRRTVYEQVGGFEEALKVAFNDVDFCLKVRQAGYLIVYNPYAVLYHYESKSRGTEDTDEKLERFEGEIIYTSDKWKDIILNGDPYYNVNLTLMKQDFSLRE